MRSNHDISSVLNIFGPSANRVLFQASPLQSHFQLIPSLAVTSPITSLLHCCLALNAPLNQLEETLALVLEYIAKICMLMLDSYRFKVVRKFLDSKLNMARGL